MTGDSLCTSGAISCSDGSQPLRIEGRGSECDSRRSRETVPRFLSQRSQGKQFNVFASNNKYRMMQIVKGSDLFEVSHDHSKIIYIVTNNLNTTNIGCRNSILFVQHLDVFLK